MANEVIRGDQWPTDPFAVAAPEPSAARAWVQLGAAIAALVVLAIALPAPWTWADTARSARMADTAAAAVLIVGAGMVWALLLWGVLVAAVAGLANLPGGLGARCRLTLTRLAPGAARKVLVTAVGVSLAGGLAGGLTGGRATQDVSAMAVGGVSPSLTEPAVPTPTPAAPQGLRSSGAALLIIAMPAVAGPGIDLDWPDQPTPTPAPPPPPPASGRANVDVVVLRGDTLWSIAARRLPPDATAAQIERSWHSWYQANREVIGADPNLILPGQRLLPPIDQGEQR